MRSGCAQRTNLWRACPDVTRCVSLSLTLPGPVTRRCLDNQYSLDFLASAKAARPAEGKPSEGATEDVTM